MKKRENGQHFIGVVWNENRSRYRSKYGKEILGYFLNPADAAKAYDVAAIDRYGKNAITNFKQKTNEKA